MDKQSTMRREIKSTIFLYMLIIQLVVTLCLLSFTANGQCNVYSCAANVNYGITNSCANLIPSASVLIGGAPGCVYNFVIMRNGVPSPPFVTSADVGLTFPYMISYPGFPPCGGNITIIDENAPLVACPAGPIDIPCGVSFNSITPPPATDCSGIAAILGPVVNVISNNGACAINIIQEVELTWTYIDNTGLSSTCTVLYNVVPSDPNDLAPPPDRLLTCTAGLDISPAAQGVPTLGGIPLQVGLFCNIALAAPTDNVINLCGNSRIIERTWVVNDLCNPPAGPYILTQTLTITDTGNPVIVLPPGPINLNTVGNTCISAGFNLPVAAISDACASTGTLFVQMTTPNGVVFTNGGPVPGMNAGTHIIVYRVTDPCGFTAEASITVHVADNTPPNQLCQTSTTVPLNNLGTAAIPASSFDNGSSDNCSPVFFKVRRMTANACDPTPQFNDQVTFCCSDVAASPITVILRVYDINPGPGVVGAGQFPGRYNECMVQVIVQDKIGPLVTCPQDVTVDCSFDLNYYLSNEIPTATDNCGQNILTEVSLDSSGLITCNLGVVVRTITYTDGTNELICNQNITVDNIIIPGGVIIDWPENLTLASCEAGNLDPESLDPPYDFPVVTSSGCTEIHVSFEDEVYTVSSGNACFKVLRKWEVIDSCIYDITDSTGYWFHYQIIKVMDTEAPVVTPIPDIIFHINVADDNCNQLSANVPLPNVLAIDCTGAANLKYRYRIDFGNNGSFDTPLLIGNNASGIYPVGVNLVSFTIDDLCGNISTLQFLVEVLINDIKPPTPILHFVSSALMPMMAMVQIPAYVFNNGSSDNCTAPGNLKFSYSANPNDTIRVFTCDSLGIRTVEIYVWDEAGNFDIGVANILITDNHDQCPDGLIYKAIEGSVLNENGELIENTTVKLENSGFNPAITSSNGEYSFENVPVNRTYTLVPGRDNDPKNGVSTIDIMLIQKHVLGVQKFNSPYKYLAADVNRSGTVSAVDMLEIQRLVLGKTEVLASNPSWRFVDADFEFDDIENPMATVIPDKYTISNLNTDIRKNFIGIKIGDINMSSSVSASQNIDIRSNGPEVELTVEDIWAEAGSFVYLAVEAKNFKDVEAFQATLQVDPEYGKLVRIEKAELENWSEENFNLKRGNNGLVPLNWYHFKPVSLKEGVPVFYLRIEVIKSTQVSKMIEINSSLLENEAASQGQFNGTLKLSFRQANAELERTRMLSLMPNPFKESTMLSFFVSEASEVIITVSDLSGKTVWQTKGQYPKGQSQVSIQSQDLGAPGVYLYKMEAPGYIETKRMILVDK
jgi:hypothetical protein